MSSNSLKSSLDKIKLTFLDQFNEIYYKIENFELLQNNISIYLEDKYKNQLNNIVKEKD